MQILVKVYLLITACVGIVLVGFPQRGLAQEAATPATTAPNTQPVYAPASRKFTIENKEQLHFKLPTNGGVVEGTIDVVRLEATGLEGWGRFEVRMTLDPNSVETGDQVRDDHISRYILQASSGPLVIGSTERLSPRARPGLGETPEDEMFGAVLWLDRRRAGKRVELRYKWEGSKDMGDLHFAHRATIKELGLSRGIHPFVEVTGPIELRFQGRLARKR